MNNNDNHAHAITLYIVPPAHQQPQRTHSYQRNAMNAKQ